MSTPNTCQACLRHACPLPFPGGKSTSSCCHHEALRSQHAPCLPSALPLWQQHLILLYPHGIPPLPVQVVSERQGDKVWYTRQHIRDCVRHITAVDLGQRVEVSVGGTFSRFIFPLLQLSHSPLPSAHSAPPAGVVAWLSLHSAQGTPANSLISTTIRIGTYTQCVG